jgi:hypothetical protein
MSTKPRIEELVGVIVGTVCFYSWVFMLLALKMKFFSTDFITNGTVMTIADNWGQIDNWLEAGILPFFLIAGHYFASGKVISEKGRINDIIGIKSSLMGFIIWLAVTIATFLLETNMSYKVTLVGGYSLIAIIYLFMKSAQTKKECSS